MEKLQINLNAVLGQTEVFFDGKVKVRRNSFIYYVEFV